MMYACAIIAGYVLGMLFGPLGSLAGVVAGGFIGWWWWDRKSVP